MNAAITIRFSTTLDKELEQMFLKGMPANKNEFIELLSKAIRDEHVYITELGLDNSLTLVDKSWSIRFDQHNPDRPLF